MPTTKLELPLTEETVRALNVGDLVYLSGQLRTGRDAVHKFLASGKKAPCDFRNGVIYHCGPVIISTDDGWEVTAAGPTTSAREEPYMPGLIRALGLRGVIGKGGMGQRTLDACRECGCVYMHAVGGAAQVLAKAITEVRGVYLMEEFGAPEAIWDLVVEEFPVLITMDAKGKSLHKDVEEASEQRLSELLRQ